MYFIVTGITCNINLHEDLYYYVIVFLYLDDSTAPVAANPEAADLSSMISDIRNRFPVIGQVIEG